MIDFLSRLREALDHVVDKCWDDRRPCSFEETALDAARRYLQGEPLLWCKTHRANTWWDERNQRFTTVQCWVSALDPDEFGDCTIVSQWRCPPPEGEV